MNKKTLVCINYYHDINIDKKSNRTLIRNYRYRKHILDKVIFVYKSYKNPVDIMITTNNNEGKNFIKKEFSDKVKYIELPKIELLNGHFLPYASVYNMSKYKDDYDIFIYAEDDMIIPNYTYIAWLKYSDLLWKHGYIQYFYRVNLKNELQDCHVEKEKKGKILEKYEIEIEGKKFGRLYRPYAGCWILNKEQFNFYLENKPIQDIREKYPREKISLGLSQDDRLLNKDTDFNKLCSIRENDIKNCPSFKSVGLIIINDNLEITSYSKVIHYNPVIKL